MFDLLYVIPLAPFIGFVILALFGAALSKRQIAFVALAATGIAMAVMFAIGIRFLMSPPPGDRYTQTLWEWIGTGTFRPAFAFALDALSLVMTFVVTFVGFLIHLYSTEYMEEDRDYARFFASMNLFIASMLLLVLGDNLLLLYFGWEGVGLCSYLLIGFWYEDEANGRAAMKAFIVTRVGDTAMAIGLYIIFMHFGTLSIAEITSRAPFLWTSGSGVAVGAAACLLGGAVGKSAQLPLQTWLPDAMAGPTPVSALIHAATMVTAGVYLIARMHVLFDLAPVVQTAVGVIGALTLLIAGFSALTQNDIKRVLAYSTISQIGYMFLALGVGAYSAAMFHFMTHAFFKALLFLAAGVLIYCLHHEQDMFKMGGLRKLMPAAFWTFTAGAISLSALPLVTAGFYSKDMIIWSAWSSERGSPWLWAAGFFGAFITAIYTFRMLFLTFYGPTHTVPHKTATWRMMLPLVILAALSIVGGFVETPETLGHVTLFSRFMESVVRDAPTVEATASTEVLFQLLSVAAVALGIAIAWYFYLKNSEASERLARSGARLHAFWKSGWAFDWLYEKLFIAPYVWLARTNKNDVADYISKGIAGATIIMYRVTSSTQNGHIRRYAAVIAAGAAIIVAIMVFS
ncbi:MAG: NADH-quinone oxidoreductase subunit L [Acidobacteriota bacterium]